jgi:hypothetical protein
LRQRELLVTGRWRLCTVLAPRGGARLALLLVPHAALGVACNVMGHELLEKCWSAWVRTFHLFRGARNAARAVALVVLATTALLALMAQVWPLDNDPYVDFVTVVSPRLQGGVIWFMTSMLAVALWYRVPVHPFHRRVLVSFVAYQALYSALLTLQGNYGFNELRTYIAIVDAIAACSWVYAAWGPESGTARAHVETLRGLELWFGRRYRVPSALVTTPQ